MSIREYLNNNSAVATIVAVVILVVSLGIIVWSNKGGSGAAVDVYFYDLNTNQLIVQQAGVVAPVDTGSGTVDYGDGTTGPAGVMATVYACDNCDAIQEGMSAEEVAAAGGRIAYFSRYSAEAKALQEKMIAGEEVSDQEMEKIYMMGAKVSPPGSNVWVDEMSEPGMSLMDAVGNICSGGEQLVVCRP